ncbi:hypothetical protein AX660_21210 [Paraglaciecola hydrolytica]|uniref:Uncharacterized protein n=1 Tax=Paraglaciecola hydrolytica TaxID=1799789 RepID=A0A148KLQ2_9ALTE|nr:hypothetical protein AX660_21210 [Paraglaciecola hydrolytica]
MLKNREILGRNCFDEITNPKQLFEFESAGILCVSHSYNAQWSGRHLGLCKENLSIYNSSSLELIAHIDFLRFPINDVDYDEKKQLLLIATGSYDGGWSYEGELYAYDFITKRLIKLLDDNREFTFCRFEGNQIEIKVLPPDDTDEKLYLKTYLIKLLLNVRQKLQDFEPIEITSYPEGEFNFESSQEKLKVLSLRLSSLANKNGFEYEPCSMAWDLKFIDDGSLFIGFANGTVGILKLATDELITKKIVASGDFSQIFKGVNQESLYVNLFTYKVDNDEYNTVFKIDNTLTKWEKVTAGIFSLSQSLNGHFLARQADWKDKKRNDILFDEFFNKITECRLGHYDLFNHYIRIDGEEHFCALLGTPNSQHQNKKLIELSSTDMRPLSEITLELQPEHYNNLNAIKVGGRYVIEAKVYNPNPRINAHVVMAFNCNGEKLWTKNISAQASGMTKIESCPDKVALSLINGEFIILDSLTGRVTLKLSKNEEINGYPLSISNNGNKIAIGYDNGLIELIELEK